MTQTIVVRRNTTSAATVPSALEHGELAANLVADPPKLWIGTPSGVKPLPSGAIISATAPSNPTIGMLWWDSTIGALFAWIDDGDSTQWVEIRSRGAGAGGAGSGVTDGSDATPGEIGEFRQIQGTTVPTYADGNTPEQNAALSLSLSPGDWDVSANCWLDAGVAVSTAAMVWLQAESVTTTPVTTLGYTTGVYRMAGLSLSPVRFNFAVTTTVLLIVRVLTSAAGNADGISASGLAQFILRARRMR